MNIPEKIYHATTQKNAFSIMKDKALKPLGMDGLTYFADTFAGASMFLYLYGVPLEDIVVIEVNTTNLNKDLFDYGRDHSTVFFKGIEVYTYSEEISDKHFSDYFKINMEENDE